MTAPEPRQPLEAGRDDLDWDSQRFGRMERYATEPDDEPETVPYQPEDK